MYFRLKNFLQERFCGELKRIQCHEIREALSARFGQQISDNEMGAIVREAFPGVIRKRSNSVNYYEKISLKVQKVDEEIQVTEQVDAEYACHLRVPLKCEGTQVDLTGGLYDAEIAVVPKSMLIERNQLISENPEILLGKGSYGEVSLQTYQGMAVAVKKYKNCLKDEVVRELLTVLNIRPHAFLPIVYGVSIERKPFLLISKFYGSTSAKRSTTLRYYLKKYPRGDENKHNSSDGSSGAASKSIDGDAPKKNRELLQIAGNICEGIEHVHQGGYLHGDIKSNNILIIKCSSGIMPKIIDFGKSCQIRTPSYSCIITKSERDYENTKLKYPHMAKELFFGKPRSIETDIFAYGVLLQEIINTLNISNTEFDVLLERTLSDLPENRPTLNCIRNVINKQ